MTSTSAATIMDALVPCGVDGLLWKNDSGTAVHFHSRPQTFIETPAYASLCEYLANDTGECSMYLCLDAPNMGKTHMVAAAAQNRGDIRFGFRGDTGMLSDAKGRICRWLKAQHLCPEGMPDPDSIRNMAVLIWKQGILRAIQHQVRERARDAGSEEDTTAKQIVEFAVRDKLHILGTLGKYLPWGVQLDAAALAEEWVSVKEDLYYCTLQQRIGDINIVLHFDEIQAIIRHENNIVFDARVPGPLPPPGSSPHECMRYILVWLSEAMKSMFDVHWLKPCLTGICMVTDASFHFPSGMPVWPRVHLPFFTTDTVKAVLLKHIHVDKPDVFHELAAGAQGCPHAVQSVLSELAPSIGSKNPNQTVASILNTAGFKLLRNNRVFYMYETDIIPLLLVILAVAFPEDAGGVPIIIDGIPAARFPREAVPLEWAGLVRMGGLRAYGDGDDIVVFPPYPFLSAFIEHKASKQPAIHDAWSFVAHAHALPLRLGQPARGMAFPLAVALELCYPESPLLHAIYTRVQASIPHGCRRISLHAVTSMDTKTHEVTHAALTKMVLGSSIVGPTTIVLGMGVDDNPAWDFVLPMTGYECRDWGWEPVPTLLFAKLSNPTYGTPEEHEADILRLHDYMRIYSRVNTGEARALACYLQYNNKEIDTAASEVGRPRDIPFGLGFGRWVRGCAPGMCVIVVDVNRDLLNTCAIRFETVLPQCSDTHIHTTTTSCEDVSSSACSNPTVPTFATSWMAAIQPLPVTTK